MRKSNQRTLDFLNNLAVRIGEGKTRPTDPVAESSPEKAAADGCREDLALEPRNWVELEGLRFRG